MNGSNLPEPIIIISIIMIIMVIINYHFDTEFCLIASEKTIYNNLTRISQIYLSIVVQKLKTTQFENFNPV